MLSAYGTAGLMTWLIKPPAVVSSRVTRLHHREHLVGSQIALLGSEIMRPLSLVFIIYLMFNYHTGPENRSQ